MSWFLEWSKYAVILVYIWFGIAYGVSARQSRQRAAWAAGIGWFVGGFFLWGQFRSNLSEFSPVITALFVFLVCLPPLLLALHLLRKGRVHGYAHLHNVLLFRSSQYPPSQPREARPEIAVIVLLLLLGSGTTLVSTGLRACHLLDRGLSISGCRRALTLPYSLQELAFSPDGQYLAATDRELHVWHSETAKRLATLPTDIEAKSVVFAPNNQLFAIGGYPFYVQLRSLADNTLERKLTIGDTAESLAFSPDGRLLSAGTRGAIYIWDIAEDRELHRLPADGEVYSVVFAPNGRLMASGGYDGQVTLWSVPDFTRLHTFKSNTIYQLAFSPDSELLAAAQFADRVTVWRVSDDYQQVWTFSGQPTQDPTEEELPYEPMWSVAFTPDSRYLVSGSGSGALRILQVADGRVQSTLQFDDQVRNVAISPDGETLAIGLRDNTVRLWRLSMALPAQASGAGE
ncbi:MAG TPA: WD40 repeat domain-containing protein [Herpetosiphonaceae bacterium]